MAAANAAVAAQVRTMFDDRPVVGVGHSMGGALVVMQQAMHRSFDRVAVLGYGYQPLAGVPDTVTVAAQVEQAARRFAALFACESGYYLVPRPQLRAHFHWPDVADEVIGADDAIETVLPRPALHAVATTAAGRPHAAALDVPVLQAWGESDNTPDPHRDAEFFSACPDYTLYVLPRSGHCHNFAGTRHLLWARLAVWLADAG
jgi:pimeloyl-ACP methyl ester carboxylesterase